VRLLQKRKQNKTNHTKINPCFLWLWAPSTLAKEMQSNKTKQVHVKEMAQSKTQD